MLTFPSRTIAWRDILLHLEYATDFRFMKVPKVILENLVPSDIQLEFIRGYADVGGNIRRANRYVDGRNRVRLDVLNDNWELPIQLCKILQLHLDIPVQNITWGHPNLGRGFREHQINVFAVPFKRVGFSFGHKQAALNNLIQQDSETEKDNNRKFIYSQCPGRRRKIRTKPHNRDENSDKLPELLRGQHFDTYWEICKAIGCKIEPPSPLFDALDEDVEET